DLKFSHGWLYKFKQRHGLKRITKHEEDASVDEEVIRTTIPNLRETLKNYNLNDIYNIDKTGFLEPDITLATICPKGKKINKEWLTLALCTNADRTDKIILFVINNKMDILTAIKFIVRGWREVSSETIKNCFQYTGIFLLVQDNYKEPTTNNNDDDIIEELYNNIDT
ncbi:9750_t:CDS:2, partial [Gigaspora margarita]